MPDILCCVAGGTSTELGFLLDLEPQVFERCMNNNYYSSVYPAQTVLKRWAKDDENAETPPSPRLRKILFLNSSPSLIVQCIFAHNYITPTFLEEQKNKPEPTKRIEQTSRDLAALEKDFLVRAQDSARDRGSGGQQ
ncbi:hypothetical protein DL766_003881 [Monosporascus sp. MC13-8B]|uniref:Uncharacterized protein n=1 Tax=Monosporascus cannonballus TaxID=155416 RepID=A0ABY0HDU6_9PEZI|nr:hypothetical protein DL763_010711 [Monosporascus cannonballus]RYO90831.1 hypothetical protein DL762_002508 [Monosporascus cannonballus]RYP32661.1 hypothetical protein DL766_003881 [Monosporascus sp. MC13-8B]